MNHWRITLRNGTEYELRAGTRGSALQAFRNEIGAWNIVKSCELVRLGRVV